MRKLTTVLITAILCTMMLGGTVQAGVPVEDLKQVVENYLDNNEYSYKYDEDLEIYEMAFSIDSSLGETDVSIFLYEDMVSVTADCPLKFKDGQFEKLAIFTTLVNNDKYYCQFRMDRGSGLLSCRSCNVIENVLPGEDEIDTLLYFAVDAMDYYGDAIASIIVSDADPYELYDKISTTDLM